MDVDLLSGWQLHQAGRSADAARCYHTLLARQPDHAEALHLFGVLHYQNGYFARAVELIGRAVALRPETAAYHANLAEAQRALDHNEEAAESCRTALRLQPNYAEAANNLGLALQALGRHAEAIEQLHAALRARPGFAMAQNNLGDVLREQGRLDDALEAFRAAVALDPNLGMARANLGQLLIDRGQVEEALPHCEEAVRLSPGLAAAHNNLGNAYRVLERWPEARRAYAEAVRLAPKLARAHANLGLALQHDDQPEQAVAALRRAVELAGNDDAEMWLALANAHADNWDFAAAIPCCERLLALKPNLAQSHVDLGWALQEVGRFAEAAASYRKALELQPDHFDTLLHQGGLHEELGALAEAEAVFRRAREVNPRAPAPLARLATLLKDKLPETERAVLAQWLDEPRLADGPRANLLFGMAQVHDACGEFAEAADCLARANALTLELRRKEGKKYNAAEHRRFVDRLLEGFTPELFGRLAGAGDPTRQPVFVVGMPRSGTTLVEQILASHSRVHGAGELRLGPDTFAALAVVTSQDDTLLMRLAALDAAAVHKLSQRHLAELAATLQRDRPGFAPDRIVDKMPDNYLYLGLLALMFPRATLIHVRREPRDIAVSCWMTNFRSIRWANDFEHLAQRLCEQRRLTAHWQAVLPLPIHEVCYERLVDDFETEARRLVEACGLDWEPACLHFHQTARPVRTASVTQVRQPLYRKAVARWKHYETALADLFDRLPGEAPSRECESHLHPKTR
ncbi:MAG TPA: tetratricopeptide repeat protein [Gemmataceae bacterium]|nr:tetratricopeptide repeat protein [Gemmataceae bacterium]